MARTPTTDGTVTGVALLNDPYAHALAQTAKTGSAPSFTMGPLTVSTNPLDLFPYSPTFGISKEGVALVIVNSLSTPLQLVELIGDAATRQGGYPAVVGPGNDPNTLAIDPSGQTILRTHQIPAAQPYPIAKNHLDASGRPLLMAGVGVYRFISDTDMNTNAVVSSIHTTGALSFSYKDKGPRLGIAFRYERIPHLFTKDDYIIRTAVTVDVDILYGGLQAFYDQTVGNPACIPVWHQIWEDQSVFDDFGGGFDPGFDPMDPDQGFPSPPTPNPNAGTVGIYGQFLNDPHPQPTNEPDRQTMTIWVYDADSTVGV